MVDLPVVYNCFVGFIFLHFEDIVIIVVKCLVKFGSQNVTATTYKHNRCETRMYGSGLKPFPRICVQCCVYRQYIARFHCHMQYVNCTEFLRLVY